MSKRRIDGIDLSHYQGDLKIDWPEAKKAGVRFLYHKATEGATTVDPKYLMRRKEAKAHGVPFGGYHFAHAKPGTAETEALHFLKVASPEPGDMAPALDLEVNEDRMSEDELATWVHTWFHVVWKHLGLKGRKRRGILYTPFNITHRPKRVRLWVARYNNDNRSPRSPKPFFTWSIWQFSDGKFGNPSTVPGVGRVDTNTLHKRFSWVRVATLRLAVPKVKHPHPPKPPRKETDVHRLLRIAGGQVGYHEGRSNGHWDNTQKFSPAVPGLEWSQGQAWCATFVSWCAMKAGLASLFPRTASTDAGAAWFKSRHQWHEYPAVGAQVFYGVNGNMEHTGLVQNYDADYIYVDEGNTNTNGSAEGDGVYRKKRARRDPYVQGYGYPAVQGGLKSADPNYKRSN